LGKGVHSAYEDAMISAFRNKILDALRGTPKATKAEVIDSGFEAARRTIELMRDTFNAIPPADIVDAFITFKGKPKAKSEFLWKKFGTKTIHTMQAGSHLVAVLWESAWALGDGESKVTSTGGLEASQAMRICARPDFLPSVTIGRIGKLLKPAPA